MDATPKWLDVEVREGASVLHLHGVWRLSNLAAISAALRSTRLKAGDPCVVDGSDLQELDTAAGFALLHQLALSGMTASALSLRGFGPSHEQLLTLVRERMDCSSAERG